MLATLPHRNLRVAPPRRSLSKCSVLPVSPEIACYMAAANVTYLARRSVLHRKAPIDILRAHLLRDGMSWFLFAVCILSWQAFAAVYPFLEAVCRVNNRASFFFYYPKASGVGLIMEPIEVVGLPYSKRRKKQIRLDWHRFSLNVGPVSRNGFRHPPSLLLNLPHIDIPERNVKHWPWRKGQESPVTKKQIE